MEHRIFRLSNSRHPPNTAEATHAAAIANRVQAPKALGNTGCARAMPASAVLRRNGRPPARTASSTPANTDAVKQTGEGLRGRPVSTPADAMPHNGFPSQVRT
ncbi:hypothetical protein GCM10009565_84610 [Amycolatopsis albidoflavus]